MIPISEEYIGSNGVRYKHIYYYAMYTGSKDEQSINKDKFEQFTEIGDIRWLTIEECYSKLRGSQLTKYEILQKCKLFMEHWQKEFSLKE